MLYQCKTIPKLGESLNRTNQGILRYTICEAIWFGGFIQPKSPLNPAIVTNAPFIYSYIKPLFEEGTLEFIVRKLIIIYALSDPLNLIDLFVNHSIPPGKFDQAKLPVLMILIMGLAVLSWEEFKNKIL